MTTENSFYGDGARALQDHFDSRRLADRLTEITLHEELDDGDLALIQAQSTVWISTVDSEGWPDVSYKGGARGFVVAVGRNELHIPIFDGNGMFRTLGNVADTGRVALLFIDVTQPWRLRVHGTGRVSTDADHVQKHTGAKAVLIVEVRRAFPNCGRYIHRGDEISAFVPVAGVDTPVPDWKKIPVLREVLPAEDAAHLAALDGINPHGESDNP